MPTEANSLSPGDCANRLRRLADFQMTDVAHRFSKLLDQADVRSREVLQRRLCHLLEVLDDARPLMNDCASALEALEDAGKPVEHANAP